MQNISQGLVAFFITMLCPCCHAMKQSTNKKKYSLKQYIH